jgi:hypothetical protein
LFVFKGIPAASGGFNGNEAIMDFIQGFIVIRLW